MNKNNGKRLEFDSSIDPKKLKVLFKEYKNYLLSIRENLPQKAFEFAIAKWHYDHEDRRCPHDSWLESFKLFENSETNEINVRKTQLEVTLLGAYHNGQIKLFYKNVESYCFDKQPPSTPTNKFNKAHGDWLIDEISLSKNRLVIHHIKFANNTTWEIHCEDIEYSWHPFENKSKRN